MLSKCVCLCHCLCLCICLCHCLFLVRSCLLITLMKCLKGHKSPRVLYGSVFQKCLVVSELVTDKVIYTAVPPGQLKTSNHLSMLFQWVPHSSYKVAKQTNGVKLKNTNFHFLIRYTQLNFFPQNILKLGRKSYQGKNPELVGNTTRVWKDFHPW